MTILLQDDFTDVDGTLLQDHTMNVGVGWTKSPASTFDATIEGNQLSVINGGLTFYTSDAAVADVNVSILFAFTIPGTGNEQISLLCRESDGNNWWAAQVDDLGNIHLAKDDGGIPSNVATGTFSADGAQHKLGIIAVGDGLSVLLDDEVILSGIDAFNQTETVCGLRVINFEGGTEPMLFDDFLVLDATPVPPVPPPPPPLPIRQTYNYPGSGAGSAGSSVTTF